MAEKVLVPSLAVAMNVADDCPATVQVAGTVTAGREGLTVISTYASPKSTTGTNPAGHTRLNSNGFWCTRRGKIGC